MKSFASFLISVCLVAILCLPAAGPVLAQDFPSNNAASTPAAFAWARTFGGATNDMVHTLSVDSSGNVYLAGEFTGTVDFDPGLGVSTRISNGLADIFLSKFDSSGNFQWVRAWGGIGRDVPNGLGVDSFGNVYITGPYTNTVDFNPAAALTDSHSSNGGTMNNIFLSKFNPSGDFQWARTWGPSDSGGESYSLAVDKWNNIYVQGDFSGTLPVNFNPWDAVHPDMHSNHPGTPLLFDAFLSKFDANGNAIWARTWGGEGYDDGPGVAVDSQGNVYVGGMYGSQTINFDPAGSAAGLGHPAHDSGFVVDVFLSKFDSSGNFLWVRTWGGQGTDDAGESVTVDNADNVYITGRYKSSNCDFNPGGIPDPHSSNGDQDVFISKYAPDGSFQWARTWGGTAWDASGSLMVDAENNVYSTGLFGSTVNFNPAGTANATSNGAWDVYFSKFDPNGNFQWVQTWGGSGDDVGYHAARNASGSVFYVAGSFNSSVDFYPGSSVETHASNGGADGFLSKFAIQSAAPVGTTTGVFRPANGLLYLKKTNASGFADLAINYGTAGDYPVAGDWDGNGTDTIGIYRNGSFYLRNSNSLGFADVVVAFGAPGDQPVVGDWDGDGTDTIGVYRNGIFYLRNSNTPGAPETSFALGNPGDVGIAGDWNGDGTDSTGVFRPGNGVIFLKNANTSGFADVALNYGLTGDKPVIGDWDNDGLDTIGVYRNATFYLRNSNTNGFAEMVFALGNPGDMPIAGKWGLP